MVYPQKISILEKHSFSKGWFTLIKFFMDGFIEIHPWLAGTSIDFHPQQEVKKPKS